MRSALAAIFGLFCVCTVPSFAQNTIGYWSVETVNTTNDLGRSASLKILPSGQPAVAYYDWTDGLIKYAWKDTAGWHLMDVAPAQPVCWPNLAILPSGEPAIAYANAGLFYAEHGPTGWQITQVPARDGISPSLIIMPSGYPAISYGDTIPGGLFSELRFAWFDGLQWQAQQVTSFTSQQTRIASTSAVVLPSGDPAIACGRAVVAQGNFGWASYSVRGPAGWSTMEVDDGPYEVNDTALVVLPSGQPAFSFYFNFVNAPQLCYAEFDGQTWHTLILLTYASGSSLAILPSGSPVLVTEFGRPTFGQRTGGTWHFTPIATSFSSGARLALLPTGQPAAVYTNASSSLSYAVGYYHGDLNCDGVINFGDINPFVLALSDPAGYQAAYPNCSHLLADANGDGVVNFADINPFVALLSGGQ